MTGRRWIRIPDAIAAKGVSRRTLYYWLATGKLDAVHRGGSQLVDADQLAAIVVGRGRRKDREVRS